MKLFTLAAVLFGTAATTTASEVTYYQDEVILRCDGVERHMQYEIGDPFAGITVYKLPNGISVFERYQSGYPVEFGYLSSGQVMYGTIIDAWVFVDEVLRAYDYDKWIIDDISKCALS